MNKRNINMLEGPYAKKIVLFAIPIMLTGILQLAFNATDLIIVGQFCGSTAVGAVGATGALTNLFVNFFMGLSVGAGVSTAHALGAKDPDRTHKTIHTAFPVAIICGAFLTVIGLTCSAPMLKLMDTPKDELPLATLYMRIYFCGSIPSLVYNFGASILRATGDTRSPLIFLTSAGILNVGLNTFFVTVFNMSVEGVAIATVMAQCLSATLVLWKLSHRTDTCKLSFSKLRIYTAPLKRILTIGVPSGIQSSLFSIANVQIQSAVNSFGSTFLAGNSAATSIGGFALTSTNAFYETSVNFIGQNTGARKPENIRKIFRTCILCVIVVGTVVGGAVALFGRQLLSIYITDSPASIDAGILRLCHIYFFAALGGIMEVSTGALRGIGNSIAPMITCILGACALRIVWLHTLFELFPTPQCLFLSFPASWLITFLVQYIIYRIVFKRRKQLWENPQHV